MWEISALPDFHITRFPNFRPHFHCQIFRFSDFHISTLPHSQHKLSTTYGGPQVKYTKQNLEHRNKTWNRKKTRAEKTWNRKKILGTQKKIGTEKKHGTEIKFWYRNKNLDCELQETASSQVIISRTFVCT